MIFHFLGSIYFAILLIASTLLFVISGTFLESITESHLFAARFTYHNPIFILLLWLYFINILFAALRRYPFKKKHVPFLITHLGLLMILGGLICKNHFGVQGAMGLSEGAGSDRIFLPHTYALLIEDRNQKRLLPLKKVGPLDTGQDDLKLTLIEWSPHSEERYEGFVKDGWGHILGLPPFQSMKTPDYELHIVKSVEEAMDQNVPALYFTQNELIAFNQTGERYSKSFDGEYLVFDKGYGGYGLFVELPPSFPKIELMTPLTRVNRAIEPHRKIEELTPQISLLADDGRNSEIVRLTFDPYGTKFKWPILGGKYLVRFQSQQQTIPFHVRLRQARQINYPMTDQPYSYESDLLINDDEATISMNHVYEKSGYRFYMANMITPPFGAKKIQIVINHDPTKYWLTYPGGIVLAIGIALLYLRKLYV